MDCLPDRRAVQAVALGLSLVCAGCAHQRESVHPPQVRTLPPQPLRSGHHERNAPPTASILPPTETREPEVGFRDGL